MALTEKQIAFDTAIKRRRHALYTGIADVEQMRGSQAPGEIVDRLIALRELYNSALAVEGQTITGHAPHKPFYLDYVYSNISNALAIPDENFSFIGITLPLVADVTNLATALAKSQDVITLIGLPPIAENRLNSLLFFQLLGFVITHEYTHFVHGHLYGAFDFEEMTASARTGNLARQAREADADGYAAYLTLALWLLSADGRRAATDTLGIQDVPSETQDASIFSCFLVAQAGYTFLREPDVLDKHRVYYVNTHPPQSVRLHLMSRFVSKFVGEFRPALREFMTQARYQALMDAVSKVVWTGRLAPYAGGWRAQGEFLKTPDGRAYRDALIAELDAFRATLNQWETASS
jgi:hypothetical protein